LLDRRVCQNLVDILDRSTSSTDKAHLGENPK
jgi:hypothetical protein